LTRRSERGQSTTEYVMIAGLMTAMAVTMLAMMCPAGN
jgi:hypothetical protein